MLHIYSRLLDKLTRVIGNSHYPKAGSNCSCKGGAKRQSTRVFKWRKTLVKKAYDLLRIVGLRSYCFYKGFWSLLCLHLIWIPSWHPIVKDLVSLLLSRLVRS